MVLEVGTRKQEVVTRDQKFRSRNKEIQAKVSGNQIWNLNQKVRDRSPKFNTMS
jgi:hypothetical protein